MQAILGLIEQPGAIAVCHLVGDLFPAVRRQAVHHTSHTGGMRQESVIDLVGREDGPSLDGLLLLAHARPGICVDHVGIAHRF